MIFRTIGFTPAGHNDRADLERYIFGLILIIDGFGGASLFTDPAFAFCQINITLFLIVIEQGGLLVLGFDTSTAAYALAGAMVGALNLYLLSGNL